MTDPILLDRDEFVATITFNRPEKHNALTRAMWSQLGDMVAGLSADDAVRCIVITGAGGRAFSAGADISEFGDNRDTVEGARAAAGAADDAMKQILDCRHPTLAGIRGYCIGGGLEIASMCDLRICSDDSTFGLPANRLGLFVTHQYLGRIADIVGRTRALEIVLAAENFGAERAEAIGLVNRVVPADDLPAEAQSYAAKVAAGAPLSQRWSKQVIRRLADPTPLTEVERAGAYDYIDTEDYRIGTQAFRDKTNPKFQGR